MFYKNVVIVDSDYCLLTTQDNDVYLMARMILPEWKDTFEVARGWEMTYEYLYRDRLPLIEKAARQHGITTILVEGERGKRFTAEMVGCGPVTKWHSPYHIREDYLKRIPKLVAPEAASPG